MGTSNCIFNIYKRNIILECINNTTSNRYKKISSSNTSHEDDIKINEYKKKDTPSNECTSLKTRETDLHIF
jgi:hypothetical protein